MANQEVRQIGAALDRYIRALAVHALFIEHAATQRRYVVLDEEQLARLDTIIRGDGYPYSAEYAIRLAKGAE